MTLYVHKRMKNGEYRQSRRKNMIYNIILWNDQLFWIQRCKICSKLVSPFFLISNAPNVTFTRGLCIANTIWSFEVQSIFPSKWTDGDGKIDENEKFHIFTIAQRISTSSFCLLVVMKYQKWKQHGSYHCVGGGGETLWLLSLWMQLIEWKYIY